MMSADDETFEGAAPTSQMFRGGAIAAALIWRAFYGWFLFGGGFPRPGLAAVPGIVSTAAIPLVLIGLLYIIAMRNSRTEMRRFGEAANLLRVESRRLERRLGRMRDQLTAARGELRSEEHTSELQSLMRISYAVFCLKKKNKQPQQYTSSNPILRTTGHITTAKEE